MDQNTIDRLFDIWLHASPWLRWGGLGLAILLLTAIVAFALYKIIKLGQRGRAAILRVTAVLSFLVFAGLGILSLGLDSNGGYILWHQVVRVIASLALTVFALTAFSFGMPRLLRRIEKFGFVQFVAVRHVQASKSGFLTAISLLSIAGVAVSAFALCVVVSIMGGFGADLKRKILLNNSDISVVRSDGKPILNPLEVREQLFGIPGVRGVTPWIRAETIASSRSTTSGILIRGIDPESIRQVVDLPSAVRAGSFEYLAEPDKLDTMPAGTVIGIGRGGKVVRTHEDGETLKALHSPHKGMDEPQRPGIILGKEVAKSLRSFVGDEITLVAPLGDLGPMGVMPRTRVFRVAGIFDAEMYEFDANYAYILMPAAQELYDLPGAVSSIELRIRPDADLISVTSQINAELKESGLTARHWQELNSSLFSALAVEKIAAFVVLSLAVLVASFCIVCTLLLMVTEKTKEIALLKAIGASDSHILRIFLAEGTIIGAIGTLYGVLTGVLGCAALVFFEVRLDAEVYYIDRLPIELNWLDYVVITVSSVIITIIAALYPARAASQLPPVEGLRYE